MNESIEILKKRRSVRKYKNKDIAVEDLKTILELGLNSPSAHDTRPWKFCAFKNNDKARLIDLMNNKLKKDMQKLNVDEKIINAKVSKSKKIFSSAPAIIVCFAKAVNHDNILDKSGEIEKILCEQSVSMAVMQMVNVATLLNISSCIFSAPLFCPKILNDICNLNEKEWLPRTLITLGFSDEEKLKIKAPIDFEEQIKFFVK